MVLARPCRPAVSESCRLLAILEVVRAGVASIGRETGLIAGASYPTCRFRDVAWMRPIVSADGPVQVRLILRRHESHVIWEITDAEAGPQAAPYCHGRWVAAQPASDGSMDLLPLEEIRSRCRRLETGEQLYQRLEKLGFNYGPGLRTVDRLWTGADELFGELRLPETAGVGNEERSAALLEGALHGLLGLSPEFSASELPLPVGLEEITWHLPLPSRCYVHAASRGEREGRVCRYDLRLIDERGRSLMILTNYTVRFVSSPDSERTQSPLVASGENCFYAPEWVESPLPVHYGSATRGCTLLLAGNDASRSVARCLLSRHRLEAPMILGQFAQSYRDCGQYHYELDPHSEPDYQALLSNLRQRGLVPSRVVFFGHTEESKDPMRPDAFQQVLLGFLTCAKSLMPAGSPPVELWHIGCEASILAGTARTISQENPRVRVRTLDLTEQDPIRAAERIVGEWQSSGDDPEIRVQNGRRHVRRLVPVQLGQAVPNPWKIGGTYLITGGAGGIGLQLAEHLVRTAQARVVLAGRSLLTPEKEQRLRAIGSSDAVSYIPADISRADEVRQLFAEIQTRFGELDGIVHAAGTTRDAYVRSKDLSEVSGLLAPKVSGVLLLDEFSRDLPLECFILCSSTAAVFGNPGQADYAAANGCLDAFSAWQREQQRQLGLRLG